MAISISKTAFAQESAPVPAHLPPSISAKPLQSFDCAGVPSS